VRSWGGKVEVGLELEVRDEMVNVESEVEAS